MSAILAPPSRRLTCKKQPAPSSAAWTAVPRCTATLVLSAFLLFSVQPLLSKMILPLLGGSASVWNTAMARGGRQRPACGSPYNVVIGDGRLKISEATENSYDAIILDAFSCRSF